MTNQSDTIYIRVLFDVVQKGPILNERTDEIYMPIPLECAEKLQYVRMIQAAPSDSFPFKSLWGDISHSETTERDWNLPELHLSPRLSPRLLVA